MYTQRWFISPDNSVLVDLSTSTINVSLKQSMSDVFNAGVEVRVGCSGKTICGSCSMKLYLDQHPDPRVGQPLFMDNNLQVLRKAYFVATTKLVLAVAGYDSSLYSGHSFRAGSASAGAAAGFSEWELKMLGRWSSDAYQLYLRDSSLVTSFAKRLVDDPKG